MYENAKYMKNVLGVVSSISVEINGVPSFVPVDEANTDYQNMMLLVSEGKLVIAPADGVA